MEIPQDQALYKCRCEEGFTGTFPQIQGHRGRRKHEECKQPPLLLISADLEDEIARLVETRPEDDPDEPDVLEDLTDPGALSFGGRTRRSAKVQDPNERTPGKPRNYGQATAVRSTFDIHTYAYAMYDAWRSNFRYGGTFNDFIVECLFDYWNICGFELVLQRHDRAAEALAQESVTTNGNQPVAELSNASSA
jgi:hypothetical protein